MARNEKYLPAGSKLVIKQVNQPAAWYTTKKEIVLEIAPVDAVCPITNEPVVTATAHGLPIWFQARMVRSRIVLAEGDVDDAVFNEQFSLMHYDITVRSEFTNPSNRLYPIAVRLTESAWMMRTTDIPYQLMAEIQDAGCAVEVNKFDKAESRRLIHQAVAKLQEELAAAVARAEASRVRAERALETEPADGEDAATPEEAEKACLKQAQAIEKRLTLLAADIRMAAPRFGIREQAVNINRLGTAAATISATMRERAAAYVAAQKALRESNTATGVALANAARDGAENKVPVYVMADALREADDEKGADRLQEAFAKDDHTFSLAGAGADEMDR